MFWLGPTCFTKHVLAYFDQYLCYQLEFLYDFFTEDRSYQYLQDATLIAFLCDKSAEKIRFKFLKRIFLWESPFWSFVILFLVTGTP